MRSSMGRSRTGRSGRPQKSVDAGSTPKLLRSRKLNCGTKRGDKHPRPQSQGTADKDAPHAIWQPCIFGRSGSVAARRPTQPGDRIMPSANRPSLGYSTVNIAAHDDKQKAPTKPESESSVGVSISTISSSHPISSHARFSLRSVYFDRGGELGVAHRLFVDLP